MKTTDEIIQTNYGYRKNLIANLENPPYVFVVHQIDTTTPFIYSLKDHRSFIIIKGNVKVEFLQEDGRLISQSYGRLEGWHALPESVYRIQNADDQSSTLIEAGSTLGETIEQNDIDLFKLDQKPSPCIALSKYKVDKPWGGEVWFTENLDDSLPYALKKIWMNTGFQSSLQSHEVKMETNYVIEGEATVLDGVIAPKDLNTVINLDSLKKKIYHPGIGWSSEHRELHRVIAKADYISIEVSTPELEDVIRWQDDNKRGNGRIDSEHGVK